MINYRFSLQAELLGQVVQSLIKLTQEKVEFWFEFYNFSVKLLYIVWCSGWSLNNLRLHKTKAMKNNLQLYSLNKKNLY